jgi:hypothetical protein
MHRIGPVYTAFGNLRVLHFFTALASCFRVIVAILVIVPVVVCPVTVILVLFTIQNLGLYFDPFSIFIVGYVISY